MNEVEPSTRGRLIILATRTGYAPTGPSYPASNRYSLFMATRKPGPQKRPRSPQVGADESSAELAFYVPQSGAVVDREARRHAISEGLDFVANHDADLLLRLEDS